MTSNEMHGEQGTQSLACPSQGCQSYAAVVLVIAAHLPEKQAAGTHGIR